MEKERREMRVKEGREKPALRSLSLFFSVSLCLCG
jgi:hypothetical protein